MDFGERWLPTIVQPTRQHDGRRVDSELDGQKLTNREFGRFS